MWRAPAFLACSSATGQPLLRVGQAAAVERVEAERPRPSPVPRGRPPARGRARRRRCRAASAPAGRGVGPHQGEAGRERRPRDQPCVAELGGDGMRLGEQRRGRRRRSPSHAERLAELEHEPPRARAPRAGGARSRAAAATTPRPCRARSQSGHARAAEVLRRPRREVGRRPAPRSPVSRRARTARSRWKPGLTRHRRSHARSRARPSRSCSSARRRFGRLPYATSRMRLCRNDQPSRAGVAGLAGTDELAPDERQQRGGRIAVHERRDVLRRERRAADGRRLHDGPIALVQPVEARREQRLDRVGERLGVCPRAPPRAAAR